MKVYYKKIDGCVPYERYFYVVMNNIAEYYISRGFEPINGDVQEIYYNNKKFVLWDCEMLIHDSISDSFKLLTFAEHMSHSNEILTYRNSIRDVVVNCHLSAAHYPSGSLFKIIPGVCVPTWCDIDLDYYYGVRKNNESYIDKFMFRGSLHGCDRLSIVSLMDNEHFYGGPPHSRDDYFLDLTKYKVGLTVPCSQEMLYRDIEYMAVGIPFMKFEYINKTTPALVPNFHYISIDRIDDLKEKERIGGPEYVERYISRWLEIKDDTEFLNFVSNNARDFYNKYIRIGNIEPHIINLLESA